MAKALTHLILFCLVALAAGCALVGKTMPYEEQESILEEYKYKEAWARNNLIDIKGGTMIERDAEVTIIDVGLHKNGDLVLMGPRRKKIVFGLELPRHFTKEQFKERVAEVLWFDPPEKRYEAHLERWGRRTAQAIQSHEIFKGMDREAALYSLGYPADIKTLELASGLQETWNYKEIEDGREKKFTVVLVAGQVNYWE